MPRNYKQGSVHVICCDDCLDGEQARQLRTIVDATLKDGLPQLVLDLRNTRVMNSPGLEFLLDVQDECVRRCGTMRLSGANSLCKDILGVTGLLDRIELYPDATSAAGAFSQ